MSSIRMDDHSKPRDDLECQVFKKLLNQNDLELDLD